MNPTREQQLIYDTIERDDCHLLKINAVAGAGKTTVLQGIAKLLKPRNGLYIAYNKAIATEASTKFPKEVDCKTTHSLAYQNTIKAHGLSVGFFNYKDIKEYMAFEIKILVLEVLNNFCLSEFHNFDEFIDHTRIDNPNISDVTYRTARKYFKKMISREIPITHAGYLKFYHMLLAHGNIKHKEFDLLMLDEAGDLNAVTLEIFKLLPAKKKLMVGDNRQNIYTFNGTINGFSKMEGKGIQLDMTQSFRCSIKIAQQIEGFCQQYVDPSMNFIGTSTPAEPDGTVAFISRTNSILIGKMIELNNRNVKYNLTRPSKSIFELVLILLSLKPGGNIFSGEWKYFQVDVNDWGNSPDLQMMYSSALKYIAALYGEEPPVASALTILSKYDASQIFAASEQAKSHEREKGHKHTLSTGYSMKGLEFSKVVIAEDLNIALDKIFDKKGDDIDSYNTKERETMMLYYVSVSRAINELENARHLPDLEELK